MYNVIHTHTGFYRQTDMRTHTNTKTHRPADTHTGLLGDSHAENGAVCSDSSHNQYKLTLIIKKPF